MTNHHNHHHHRHHHHAHHDVAHEETKAPHKAAKKSDVPSPTEHRKSVADWGQAYNAANIEKEHDLPSGTLLAIMAWESFGDPNAHNKNSKGLMQLDAVNRKGLKPGDHHEEFERAAKKVKEYQKEFDGDFEKAIVAYNWGDGALRGYLAHHHGADWKAQLPDKIKYYVEVVPGHIDIYGEIQKMHAAHGAAYSPEEAQRIEAAIEKDPILVKFAQERLHELGYYKPGEDASKVGTGKPDAEMAEAVQKFKEWMPKGYHTQSASEILVNDGQGIQHLDFAMLDMLASPQTGMNQLLRHGANVHKR